MSINADYIKSIPYTPTNKLSAVKADPFLKALAAAFGETARKAMTAYVFSNGAVGTKYEAGMKLFQDRFMKAIGDNEAISADDQKYLVDLTQRVALGQLQVIISK